MNKTSLNVAINNRQREALDLGVMVWETRYLPINTSITCGGLGWCRGQPLVAELLPTNGEILLIQLQRLGHIRPFHVKVTTPIREPSEEHEEWEGKSLIAVLCHSQILNSNGGHWITYRRVRGQWFELDSTTINIVARNPFIVQSDDVTIDYLLFK